MIQKLPLVSIIMSIYNNESTLIKSVSSILDQTYDNFEFLIIDDKSTDNSLAILSELAEKDQRIKIIKNDKNIGLTESLNKLIDISGGQYIARQDGDDFSEKERLREQVKFLEREKDFDACSTRSKIINSTKVIPNFSRILPIKHVIKFKNPIVHGSLMINSKTIKELGSYNKNFYYAQDYKLIYDLIKNKYRIKILNSILYNSNMHNNISTINFEEQKYYATCVRRGIIPEEIN